MPSPTFDYEYRDFAGPMDFEAYVMSLPPVRWAEGVVLHHTYSPTLPEWHVSTPRAELDKLAHYYQYDVKNKDGSTGWPAGPHLFISDVGIYQMTPLTHVGVHAGPCNSNYWGIEVVGNYDNHYWSPGTEHLVLGATAVLMRHAHVTTINEKTLRGHRDCASPKTCPGSAISMDLVRNKVTDLMITQSPHDPGTRQVIGVNQSITVGQWIKYLINNGVQMPDVELRFVYSLLDRLQIDASFFAAVWKQGGFEDDPTTPDIVAVIGGSELQRQTHNPFNLQEPLDTLREHVIYKGKAWRKFESWQIGLIDGSVYLKQEHGAHGRLTINDIIDSMTGSGDNHVFKTNVLKRMDDMKGLTL